MTERLKSELIVRPPTPHDIHEEREHLVHFVPPEGRSQQLSNSSVSKCPLCSSPINSVSPALTYFHLLESLLLRSESPIPEGCVSGFYSTFFEEIGRIGSGSFGVVVKVLHKLAGGIVLGKYACKKISIGDVSLTATSPWLLQAIREAQILSKLSHPNIINYKYAWIEKHKISPMTPNVPTLFLLMDLAVCSVSRLIPVSVSIAYTVLLDICLALNHLHTHSFIHGDVKPTNILVMMDEQVSEARFVLSDLGQTRAFKEEISESNFESFLGTVEYLPPSVRGLATSSADDVFSLGVSLYELISGITTFDVEVIKSDQRLPLQLKSIIISMLNPNSAFRPKPIDLISNRVVLSAAQIGRQELFRVVKNQESTRVVATLPPPVQIPSTSITVKRNYIHDLLQVVSRSKLYIFFLFLGVFSTLLIKSL
ncbi:hypothetical protein RCL1_000366 [Eukaryota sp. TZLM3-RCL]